jgi:hypothetical protein
LRQVRDSVGENWRRRRRRRAPPKKRWKTRGFAAGVASYVASDGDRQRPQHVGQREGSSRHVSAGASKAVDVIQLSPGSLLNYLLRLLTYLLRCLIKVVSGWLKDAFTVLAPHPLLVGYEKLITSGKIISPKKQITSVATFLIVY